MLSVYQKKIDKDTYECSSPRMITFHYSPKNRINQSAENNDDKYMSQYIQNLIDTIKPNIPDSDWYIIEDDELFIATDMINRIKKSIMKKIQISQTNDHFSRKAIEQFVLSHLGLPCSKLGGIPRIVISVFLNQLVSEKKLEEKASITSVTYYVK